MTPKPLTIAEVREYLDNFGAMCEPEYRPVSQRLPTEWLAKTLENERLRKRTHEIQEAADKRNALLHREHERYLSDKKWATMQLAVFRKAGLIEGESVFDRLCIINLRDEWQAERDSLNVQNERLWEALNDEAAQCGYCLHRGIVSDFTPDDGGRGSECPKCNFVDDSPPVLDAEERVQWMREIVAAAEAAKGDA